MNLAELASKQAAKLRSERERNRERFPFAAEMLDALAAGGIDARIVYAENAQGETVGKRDQGPWIDGLAMVRAADEHARWFGDAREVVDSRKRRVGPTASQQACLRGDA